ncbi:sensor histidine kinase [Pseudaestuariivita atlantica]|uniref:histidine kinase n=1 Tax=Pseudaestuariivita atlantica TaxID=1317121 RepID=A0A0L1JNB2_9RHOB|nr:sensor histidine kinase [Pseudaestuariivita atlantica]KNG93250.1 histidine kinase [Pseudaestuariivita atlantica]
MSGAWSLRARLTAIILLPLLSLATVAGLWQLTNARRTAAEVFDRSLLGAALAVVNDVASSGGDALSPATRDLLADTSGGPVFYHVYAPDGVIVAGYATPPVGIPRTPESEVNQPTRFEATYQGRRVSGVRLQTRTSIEGFTGIFTTTVWQDAAVRSAFVRDLVLRSVAVIAGLIVSLALIVWFGVRYGLRPLTDLEDAIAQRSSDELSPIRRPVPGEVRGIVATLNSLFAQVSRTLEAQSEFISNAAHQLRNPVAGILSLAEAVERAPDAEAARVRARDLTVAAREAAELSQKLLVLERASAVSPSAAREDLELAGALRDWVGRMQVPEGVTIAVRSDRPVTLRADATMLRESLANLVDNAVRHGGARLSRIDVSLEVTGDEAVLTVADDGEGVRERDLPRTLERFAQIAPTSASGVGLSIVEAVAQGHLGWMKVDVPEGGGFRVRIGLPRSL